MTQGAPLQYPPCAPPVTRVPGDLPAALADASAAREREHERLPSASTAGSLPERERALREVTQLLATDLDERRVLALVVRQAARLLAAPRARVWLLEEDGSWRCAAAEGAPLGGDALLDGDAPPAAADGALAAPVVRAGEQFGVLEVRRDSQRPFTLEDEQLLVGLANTAAAAVGNARTLARAEQLAARAAASEQRYRSLFEHNPVAVFSLDLEGCFTSANPACEAVTGYSPAELQGRALDPLLDAEDRPRVREALEAGGHGEARTWDLRVHHKEGRPIELHGTSLPIVVEGRVVGVYGVAEDVTLQRAAERQTVYLARTEKLRALGQMASGVAHDLNQSLTLVAGYADLAHQEVARPAPDLTLLREALETITRAALDGGDTVRRLLAFGRGQPEGKRELLDVRDVLREVARLTAPRWRDACQAEGRHISLHVETNDDRDLLVRGWGASLREALTNLVFNAVDALPAGGAIRLSARQQGREVQVAVTDTGVGMTDEVQARVFEPFFTTKGERGTGLGLAMVFSVVEQHGGRVTVDSAVGRGTTFWLTLPAASRPRRRAPEQPESAPVRGLRVLAVDDEPALARMVALMLQRHGHQVTTAHSAEAALALLEQAGAEQASAEQASAEPEPGGYDVVVSDLGMGEGLSGWDLAARVKRRWPGTRVVLATGWGSAIDPAEARARGVDAVVPKPYRAADLERLTTGA